MRCWCVVCMEWDAGDVYLVQLVPLQHRHFLLHQNWEWLIDRIKQVVLEKKTRQLYGILSAGSVFLTIDALRSWFGMVNGAWTVKILSSTNCTFLRRRIAETRIQDQLYRVELKTIFCATLVLWCIHTHKVGCAVLVTRCVNTLIEIHLSYQHIPSHTLYFCIHFYPHHLC